MRLEITIEYGDPATADTIFGSVGPDNMGMVTGSVSGGTLTFVIEAEGAGTLRNTADDLLACIRTAEQASGLVPGPVPDLDGDALPE